MFRVTRYVKSLLEPTPVPPAHKPPGPVVIWNLIRRCNLTCKHCYTVSADIDFKGSSPPRKSSPCSMTSSASACRR
ncbi:hypothetical protein [Halomonas sp. E19]|uniref:hypothetical protein n=1 Tax=Halomonas sp. E19 TaxID=3397247 RepID=UPI0040345D9B